jgi:hypothetical protein
VDVHVDEFSTTMVDIVDISDLGEVAVRLADDLREQIARDRATAQALRDYLSAATTR